MTRDAQFFSGDVMAQHWSDEDSGTALMVAEKEGAKKKTTRKVKATNKKTCF